MFNALCTLFLTAYVWLHGNDFLVLASDVRQGHLKSAHLQPAFAIVGIACAALVASKKVPDSGKILITILAPFVAVGLMLATE